MASAGGGAFYDEKENPTRLVCQPGGTLLGTGTLAYVNSTGSEKMKSLNLLNCGVIAPGGQEGKPGTLTLTAADVTFGSEAEKGPLPRGAGIPQYEPGLPCRLASQRAISSFSACGRRRLCRKASFRLSSVADRLSGLMMLIRLSSGKATSAAIIARQDHCPAAA
ncbi:MAG TPA: hypothetical protein VM223_24045 [Planctomycetota bacterium]|nr:hypothetical protein [Planctomycetota bacterium]